MTDLLDKAITAARNLPPEVQDAYRFTPEEEAELDESGAAAACGDFATDEEVRAIWAKHGLHCHRIKQQAPFRN